MYWKGLSGINRVNREKAKELAVRRKNWRVLIVSRKKVILKFFPFKNNGKKLTVCREMDKILTFSRNSNHPIEIFT